MKNEGQRLVERRACPFVGVGVIAEKAHKVAGRRFRGLDLAGTDRVGDDFLKVLRDVRGDGDRALCHGDTSRRKAPSLKSVRLALCRNECHWAPWWIQGNDGFGGSFQRAGSGQTPPSLPKKYL